MHYPSRTSRSKLKESPEDTTYKITSDLTFTRHKGGVEMIRYRLDETKGDKWYDEVYKRAKKIKANSEKQQRSKSR